MASTAGRVANNRDRAIATHGTARQDRGPPLSGKKQMLSPGSIFRDINRIIIDKHDHRDLNLVREQEKGMVHVQVKCGSAASGSRLAETDIIM